MQLCNHSTREGVRAIDDEKWSLLQAREHLGVSHTAVQKYTKNGTLKIADTRYHGQQRRVYVWRSEVEALKRQREQGETSNA